MPDNNYISSTADEELDLGSPAARALWESIPDKATRGVVFELLSLRGFYTGTEDGRKKINSAFESYLRYGSKLGDLIKCR